MMSDRCVAAGLSLFLVLVAGGFPLSTQAQSGISVTVPEPDPTPGNTVTLSIEVDLGGKQVDGYSNMEFTFDDSVLEIIDVRDGDELSFGTNTFDDTQPEPGTLRITNDADNPPVSGSGEFLKIDVELKAGFKNPGTFFRLAPSFNEPGEPFVSTFREAGSTSILEIKTIDQGKVGDLEVQNARDEGPSSTATVRGTVTRAFGSYVRFQDDSDNGSPSGLTIGPESGDLQQDITDSKITQGTELYVRGTLSDSDGLLRIDGPDLNNYVILDQGVLPAPQEVSLSTLQSGGEDYESELLRVDGLSFPGASGTFSGSTTYVVEDETGDLNYRVESSDQTELIGESIPTGTFTYEGVLGESSDGFQLVPIRPATALPVTLTGFTAVRNGSSTVLTWRTASETNNAGFRVQHERAAGWQELGFVPSTADDGTTGEAQSYRFVVDRRLGPGTHRFRLEQVDLDRSTALSDTVQVEVGMEGTLHLSAPAPNPSSERATLSFAVQEGRRADVAVYDVLGQRVQTLYEGTPPGEEARRVTVETGTLSSGVYVVRLRAGGRTQTRRLTVVQ
jgi:hypothetical protein